MADGPDSSAPADDAQGSDAPLVTGFPLGPFQTNCYVITVGEDPECWIVDAGFDPGPLIEHIRSHGLKPSKILLTHAHADHIAGLDEVRHAFGEVPILLHPAEHEWLRNPALNLSGGMGFPIKTPGPDGSLEEGMTLTLCGSKWRVLHTPGHSPGGISLVHDDSRCALVGDTLFAGSIGRHDFPTSDFEDLQRSIREKLYALPDDTICHPGHGPSTMVGMEAATNPFVRRETT